MEKIFFRNKEMKIFQTEKKRTPREREMLGEDVWWGPHHVGLVRDGDRPAGGFCPAVGPHGQCPAATSSRAPLPTGPPASPDPARL